ncbi:MAG: TolC family protein, partial [Ignavibacteria bacterium]|nr:TolC family protein [Ignavibacteria bacterium]
DYEEKRLEVITDVRMAFAQAFLAQKLIEKNKELIKISEEFILNLNERVKAGKISPAEVSRAKIILNSLKIELTKLEARYYASISELDALTYDPSLIITSLRGTFEYPLEAPTYDSLLAQLGNNPSLKRYDSEYDKQEAVIELEESKSIPDLTINVGYRRLNEVKVNTFVLGASIPIPLFDRNQGSIQEAQIKFDQKKIEYESVRNKLKLRLNILYNRLSTLLNTTQLLKKESLPEAEKSFKTIKEGNMVGRFAILDVLDAERTLFEIQNQYLNTISEMYVVRIEIEGLIAKEIQ